MRHPARTVLAAGAALAVLVAGCSGVPAPLTGPSPRVVEVRAARCDRPGPSLGLGAVVADGMVLTAAHVVDDADRSIEVGGRTASIVGVDARTDLALLSVATGGWQRVPLARVDAGAGDEVTIATADGDIATVVDRAVTLDVTDVTDDTRWRRETLVLATGVEGGTSGAPVLDGAGRMTGVVVLSSRSGGQAYAVTGGEVRRFVDGSRAAGNRTSLAVTTGCA